MAKYTKYVCDLCNAERDTMGDGEGFPVFWNFLGEFHFCEKCIAIMKDHKEVLENAHHQTKCILKNCFYHITQ